MKLYLISDNLDTLVGMRLSGIEGVEVHEREEFSEAVKKVLEMPDLAVVLITEKLNRTFPDLVRELKKRTELPMVVEVPDRHGTEKRADYITAYVNEAIGIKL